MNSIIKDLDRLYATVRLKSRTPITNADRVAIFQNLNYDWAFFKQIGSFSPAAGFSSYEKKVQWNPISQQIPVDNEGPVKSNNLQHSFIETFRAFRNFSFMMHESNHILFWEPFFTGVDRPKTAREYRRLALGLEGANFWNDSFNLSPALSKSLKAPDGEKSGERQDAGNRVYAGRVALSELGCHKKELLREFINVFQGKSSKMGSLSKMPIALNVLAKNGSAFYGGRKKSDLFFNILNEMEIFTSYFDRFCKKPGIPALFDWKFRILNREEEFADYLFGKFWRDYRKKSVLDLNRIRLRRRIQTRAYFAFELRHLLKDNLVFSQPSGKIFGAIRLIPSVERYLDGLEKILERLIEGAPLFRISRELQNNDRFYEDNIRKNVRSECLWMAKRYFVLPLLETSDHSFGLKADGEIVEATEYELLLDYAKDLYENSRVKGLGLQAEIAGIQKMRNEKSKRRKMNELISRAPVLNQWSLPLSDMSPLHDQFPELYFRYI
jgi:hypothetical protein